MAKYICIGYKKKKTLKEPKEPFNIKKEVSIILPTYNEEKNIGRLIKELRKEFKKESYEIVILDDNSKDRTPRIIDKEAKKGNLLAIHRYEKRGYFSAYQDAISMANGKYVLLMDADFSHLPETAKKLFDLRNKSNIISASRYTKGGVMNAPFLRKYGSMFLNHLGIFIIGLKQTDATNEFLIIEKNKFKEMEFRYKAVFGEFDFELLYRAKQKKLSVLEIPCVYVYRKEGSSAMGTGISDALKLMKFASAYIKMALKIRFYG
ncbi:MAG: glycosyltransferase [Nanoarchaeota archaeon]